MQAVMVGRMDARFRDHDASFVIVELDENWGLYQHPARCAALALTTRLRAVSSQSQVRLAGSSGSSWRSRVPSTVRGVTPSDSSPRPRPASASSRKALFRGRDVAPRVRGLYEDGLPLPARPSAATVASGCPSPFLEV